jgi:hypothetical protein
MMLGGISDGMTKVIVPIFFIALLHNDKLSMIILSNQSFMIQGR